MENLANDVKRLIERARTYPNSKERNKVISKLEDALAWAQMAKNDMSAAPNVAQNEPAGPYAELDGLQSTECICKPGMVMASCPVHGVKT